MTPNDHYVQAAFIGGFGRAPRTGAPIRKYKVGVRFKNHPDETQSVSAEDLGGGGDIYRMDEPPDWANPNFIDEIWKAYEPKLPKAIKAFEAGTWGAAEWSTIAFHLLALGVRHPDFANHARSVLSERGEPVESDDIQRARINTLGHSERLLGSWKFAVLHRPDDAHRFVVNDKAYANVSESDTRKASFFPLSGEVGILGVVDAGDRSLEEPPAPSTTMVVTPGTVATFNEVSWDVDAVRWVIGHPEEQEHLLQLVARDHWEQPRLGPYRDRGSEGLLDWALGAEDFA